MNVPPESSTRPSVNIDKYPQHAPLLEQNDNRTNQLREASEDELKSRMGLAIREKRESIAGKTRHLIAVVCMDERCSCQSHDKLRSVLDPAADAKTTSMTELCFPPVFLGDDMSGEEKNIDGVAQRIVEEIEHLTAINQNLDITLALSIHEGCGGGKALHAMYYGGKDGEDYKSSVQQHWQKLAKKVQEKLKQKGKNEIKVIMPDLRLADMKPNIPEHYAGACIVDLFDNATHELNLTDLQKKAQFPATYKIDGKYLSDETLVGLAVFAATIAYGDHTIEGMVSRQDNNKPFTYVIPFSAENGERAQQFKQNLTKALQAKQYPFLVKLVELDTGSSQ